ncbi:putative oxidoreductase [Gordonia sihwensis NBRC 108236]|nr:putative oxidoreductase [Gordonia sihwensis NBRC 108236]
MRLSEMLSELVPGSYARSNPRIEPPGAVVVVTGGARGIGAEIARQFAEAEATVWIGDVDADVAADTAGVIDGARSAVLDVTDAVSWREFVSKVLDECGRIDILVNNAGVMPVGAFLEESEATADLILDVNVRGMLNGMRAVLPSMLGEGRGHIVNIASMAGMLPLPGMVSYNASKFAAYGASLAARREYDGTGVTVSAILPAAVRTELASGADLGGVLPTVDPQDVARAVVRTVRTRAARTSVPGWVLPGWSIADLFVPESVERVARTLAGHGQALALDAAERSAYLARIARQASDHAAGGHSGGTVVDGAVVDSAGTSEVRAR